jgi:hypothetical protein
MERHTRLKAQQVRLEIKSLLLSLLRIPLLVNRPLESAHLEKPPKTSVPVLLVV